MLTVLWAALNVVVPSSSTVPAVFPETLAASPPTLVRFSPQEPPYLSAYVMDEANLLSAAAEGALNERLQAFASESGSQVVVLTVPNLGGSTIEEFSIRRAEAWQLGRADQDDGVLFVIAQAERRMRIEVGYGLEGALTDAATRRILDNVVGPQFRAGDFDGGVEAGVTAILGTIRGEVPPPDALPPQPVPDHVGLRPLLNMFLFMLLVILLIAFMARRSGGGRRRRGWSSRQGWHVDHGPIVIHFPHDRGSPGHRGPGGWGGGFGGGMGGGGRGGGGFGGGLRGGGGGFGGGGASGSW